MTPAPTTTPLSATTYAALPMEVGRPAYDRGAVTAGIVHFGVGGFHRAHEAMYLDRLMDEGEALEVALRLKALAAQRRLLMMGPDCGTAVLDGVPLGFANVLRSGPVGIRIRPSMRRDTRPRTSSRSRSPSSSVLDAITTTPRSRALSSTARSVSLQNPFERSCTSIPIDAVRCPVRRRLLAARLWR